MADHIVRVAGLLACPLAALILAVLITTAIAPRIEALAVDDPTPADDEDTGELPAVETDDGEQPSIVDPQPTLREQMVYLPAPVYQPDDMPRHYDPYPVTTVGDTVVHRSCNNARRDGDHARVCSWCAPRLAGIPTTGGTP